VKAHKQKKLRTFTQLCQAAGAANGNTFEVTQREWEYIYEMLAFLYGIPYCNEQGQLLLKGKGLVIK